MKWLVLWSLWAARLLRQPAPVRQLASGAGVRGRLAPDGSHEQYFGIPYASSGFQYRFQAPGPAPTWNGILEAVDENIKCPQVYGDSLVLGAEECLTLNIYKPVQAGPLKPVMVFIHGGGFKEGSGSRLLYGPAYLVSKDVLVVTINYRNCATSSSSAPERAVRGRGRAVAADHTAAVPAAWRAVLRVACACRD